MEGDALEMEVREANNGKVSKHQRNATQCNIVSNLGLVSRQIHLVNMPSQENQNGEPV